MIATAPSVVYKLHMRDGTMREIHNPADMPDPNHEEWMEEPWIEAREMLWRGYYLEEEAAREEKRGQETHARIMVP